MNVIIDHFEDDFAVLELENGSYVNIPKEIIPSGTDEGTVLSITVNREETEKLKTGKDLNKENSSDSRCLNSLNDLFNDSHVDSQPCKEFDTEAPVGREIW